MAVLLLRQVTTTCTIRKGGWRLLRKSCEANHSINQDVTEFTGRGGGGDAYTAALSITRFAGFLYLPTSSTCQITLLLQLQRTSGRWQWMKSATCRWWSCQSSVHSAPPSLSLSQWCFLTHRHQPAPSCPSSNASAEKKGNFNFTQFHPFPFLGKTMIHQFFMAPLDFIMRAHSLSFAHIRRKTIFLEVKSNVLRILIKSTCCREGGATKTT